MTQISIGLAGLGRFGRLHTRIIQSLPYARVTAVYDPDSTARAAATDDFGVETTVDSFSELLAHPGLDCIYIVTPEHLHEEMVEEAIGLGKPIFVEKPLALSSARGRELVAKANAAGVYLQVGFVLRFDAKNAYLRQEIQRGAFGRLVTIRAKRNMPKTWFDIYGDRAHAVYETLIHDIDQLVWLTGSRGKSVYAMEQRLSSDKTFPDATLAVVRFENGTMASLETSWLLPERAPSNVLTDTWAGTIDAEMEVTGEFRTARLRVLESGLEIWSNELDHRPDTGWWPEVHGEIAGALRAEDEHFLSLVANGGRSTIASVEEAVEGLRIAEAIEDSARSGREIVLG
jgi:predicted dehydrogenase